MQAHGERHRADQRHRDRVDGDGLRAIAVDAQQPRGEGDEGDDPQVEQVEGQQAPVDAADRAEEGVMAAPEQRDHGEAHRVAEQLTDIARERVPQALPPPTSPGTLMLSTRRVSAIANTPSLSATVRS